MGYHHLQGLIQVNTITSRELLLCQGVLQEECTHHRLIIKVLLMFNLLWVIEGFAFCGLLLYR
ncbi:hypothetical protein CsatB_023213 [Cannabis sativa]